MKAEEAADVWSLGSVCFELFRGRPLFGDETADDHVIAMLLGYAAFPRLWVPFSFLSVFWLSDNLDTPSSIHCTLARPPPLVEHLSFCDEALTKGAARLYAYRGRGTTALQYEGAI